VNLADYRSLGEKRNAVVAECRKRRGHQTLMTDCWTPSKPVLHLCAGLSVMIGGEEAHCGVELWHLIAGDGVALLLEHALQYRKFILEHSLVADSDLVDIQLT
jgi:hypothetical protein